KGVAEIGPGIGGGPGTDLPQGLLAEAAPEEILAGPRPGPAPEVPAEVLGRRLQQGQHLVPLLAVGPGLEAVLRDRYPEPPRHRLDGLGEADALVEHDELEHVAALAAAEAVEEGRVLADVEGRCFLLMERAESLPGRAHLAQAHLLGDVAHDVGRAPDLLHEAVRE